MEVAKNTTGVWFSSPFPDSERVVFTRNPLQVVISQVQFPAILTVATETPSLFQEQLRADFPVYESTTTLGFPAELSGLLKQGVNLPTAVSHVFRSADGKRVITLTPTSVAFEDKDYRGWADYRANLFRAYNCVRQIYNSAEPTRVGLRYVDVIQKSKLPLLRPNAGWNDLIREELLGLSSSPSLAPLLQEMMSAAVIRLGEPGGSVVRVQYGVRVLPQLIESDESVFVIDADIFSQAQSELQNVTEFFDGANRVAGRLFRWAITEELHAALEPRHV